MIISIRKLKKKYFDKESCMVYGKRGSGKDTLMGNIAVRDEKHISNISYGNGHIPLDLNLLDIKNDFSNFVDSNINKYVYPYPEKVNIYLSDIGVYFPSQYNDKLNKLYPRMPYFLALLRQLSDGASVHLNAQSLPRVWDKFREQSELYVYTRSIKWLPFGFIVQKIRIYETYESAKQRVPPFRLPKPPLFSSRATKLQYEIEKERYSQTHGNVISLTVFYRNKSTFDSRHFNTLLSKGK